MIVLVGAVGESASSQVVPLISLAAAVLAAFVTAVFAFRGATDKTQADAGASLRDDYADALRDERAESQKMREQRDYAEERLIAMRGERDAAESKLAACRELNEDYRRRLAMFEGVGDH